jgi:hypothetical protein
MKHYFKPGREDFRAAILKAMPKMLAEGERPGNVRDEMRVILERMTAKTWRRDRTQLLQVVDRG